MVVPARLAVGVKGLVDALNTARGATWCFDDAGRAKFVPPIGGAFVVRCEVLRAQGNAALFHGAACTDHSGPSFISSQGPNLPVRGAVLGADATLLLLVGNVLGIKGYRCWSTSRTEPAGGGRWLRQQWGRGLPWPAARSLWGWQSGTPMLPPPTGIAAAGPEVAAAGASATGGRWRSPRVEEVLWSGVDLGGRGVGLSLIPESGVRLLLGDHPGG